MAKRTLKKRIAFRLCAVLVGLLPFLLLELFLGAIGWRPLGGIKDPFVGFSSSRPLFELNQDGTAYEISESRKPLFCDDSFPANKAGNEFRIFCVGGSTVQGRPYAIETSFSTWLELSLRAADESRQYNVINCGGVSYASYRLAPIIEEILDYQPDLIVLYTGHNEFLEDRTYDVVKKTSPLILNAHEKLSALRTYSFFRSLALQVQSQRPDLEILPGEVQARLDYSNGLAKYTRDEEWKSNVVKHFRHNLERIALAALSTDVPLMICSPVSNLRDASPFKSQNQSGLSEVQLSQFESGFEQLAVDEGSASIEQLKALLEIDPAYAHLQYRIGQAYQMTGDFANAKRHLVEAKEQDICPLRIIEPMYEVIEETARKHQVALVDVKALFESQAPDGIPGSELLVDHVHPSMHGHQLIADLILNEMKRQGFVKTADGVADGFDARRTASFDAHFASLPNLYFELGKERLGALRRWAEGKSTHVR